MENHIIRFNRKSIADREIDELIGLCRGIIADGHICDAEAQYLLDWLERQVNNLNGYPFNILYTRLTEMLEDNTLDVEEQIELIELFSKIIGDPVPNDTVSAPAMPYTDHQFDSVDALTICLTGEFEMGKRADIARQLEDKGATFSKSVTQKIDVLYIGAIGNTAWKHSSFGRKIEKVQEFNGRKGLNIAVLGEEHLAQLL